jgi:hypothetical protein
LENFRDSTWVGGSSREGSRENRLGKGKPEFEGMAGKGNTWVDESGVHGGAEGEIGNAVRPCTEVGGDSSRNGGADVVTEAKRNEVIDGEKSGTDGFTNIGSLEGSIERTVWDMAKSGDKFGRAVKWRVLEEQIREEIETTGLEIGSGADGRGRRHEKFNSIRRTTERETKESGR